MKIQHEKASTLSGNRYELMSDDMINNFDSPFFGENEMKKTTATEPTPANYSR